ncbi:MAG TPA: glycosyltransferase [Bacteroidales bacterium]|nr:glycosyltransferase [Bacteroidales bacterium]HCI56058.1 hypothetical protein [Bacteroidales bacterium]HQJ20995.1 glycosyltransferase [Bacteroidales bacterium]HRC88644.1 glycosyltransferase [Bacteroidales bacterium]
MLWLLIIPFIIYSIILIHIAWYHKEIEPFQGKAHNAGIKVSVVVACRDEENNLPGLLSCLSKQDYPQDFFEVIIVDDNSTDSTFDLSNKFDGIKNLQVIRNHGTGKKFAIKKGVEVSSSELILTTDADCRMGTRWLSSVVSFYNHYKPEMIIAPVNLLKVNNRFLNSFQIIEWQALQGITAGTAAQGNPVMCNGANLGFKRETFLNHSYGLKYNLASGDDIFLLQTLKKEKKSNIRWLESNEAVVTTPAAPTLMHLLMQRARWISKAGFYKDPYIIIIALVTFCTNIELLGLYLACILNPTLAFILISGFVIKSASDFALIKETIRKSFKPVKSKYFFVSEILYPLYVLIVSLKTLTIKKRWK